MIYVYVLPSFAQTINSSERSPLKDFSSLHITSISMGGITGLSFTPIIGSFYNPSLGSYISKKGMLSSVVLGTNIIGVSLQYTYPIENTKNIYFQNSTFQISSSYLVTERFLGTRHLLQNGLSWSKQYFKSLSLGLKLHSIFAIGSYQIDETGQIAEGQEVAGMGLDPGLNYIVPYSVSTLYGFGIHRLDVHLFTRNLTYFFKQDIVAELLTPNRRFNIGSNLHFFNYGSFRTNFHFEFSIEDTLLNYPIQLGASLQLFFIRLYWGYTLNSIDKMNLGYTFTIGLEHENEVRHVIMNMGLLSPRNSFLKEISLWGTLGMHFGSKDFEPPKVYVQLPKKTFSPNNDGVQDQISWKLNVQDGHPIKYWKIIIFDSNMTPIRVLESNSTNSTSGNLSLSQKNITSYFFSIQEKIRHPYVVSWNGLPAHVLLEKKLSDNNIIRAFPDGKYYYQIESMDMYKNKTLTSPQNFFIDTTPSEIKTKVLNDVLTFSESNAMQKIHMQHTISYIEDLSSIQISILDQNYKIVKILYKSNKNFKALPSDFYWDGTNKYNNTVQSGKYYYYIKSIDKVGNFFLKTFPVEVKSIVASTSSPFLVSMDLSSVNIKAKIHLFTPDGDGQNDEQIFRVKTPQYIHIKQYQINIYEVYIYNHRQNKRLVRSIQGRPVQKTFSVIWNGLTNNQTLVESYTDYKYQLVLTTIEGKEYKTKFKTMRTGVLVMLAHDRLRIRLSNIPFYNDEVLINKKVNNILRHVAFTLREYTPYYFVKVESHSHKTENPHKSLLQSEKRAVAIRKYLLLRSLATTGFSYQGLGELYPLVSGNSNYNITRNNRIELILTDK